MSKKSVFYLLGGMGLWLAPMAMADTYTDGFEGASISPFWAAAGPGASLTALTTSFAHGGSKSVELQASASYPWYSWLYHDFGSQQFGSVSVWVRSGTICCGSAAALVLADGSDPNTGFGNNFATFQRTTRGDFVARFTPPGGSEIDTVANTGGGLSPDWHQLEIDTGAGGVTFKFDGTTIYTNPAALKFRTVVLSVWGGPGGSEYFDDFSARTGNCQVNPADVNLSAVGPYSLDGKPTGMRATFTPTLDGLPAGLGAAEAACGVKEFNWQQKVNVLPFPGPLYPANPSLAGWPAGLAFTAPKPNGSFPDPPNGGYTCPSCPPSLTVHTAGRYPFYWDVNTAVFDWSLARHETANTLSFVDYPADPCLLGGAHQLQRRFCDGGSAPPFSDLEFTTQLVGIRSDGSVVDNLFSWTWESTFNGVFGRYDNFDGTGGIAAISNYLPVDPTSGSGGITITSVNGVPQAPPAVSCTATPNTLGPPNAKPVLVTVSGDIIPGTSALAPGGATYAVANDRGRVKLSGNITVGTRGSYSFGVPTVAAWDGDDDRGRTYTITVRAKDQFNVGSCSAVVKVGHGQGH